MFGQKQDRPTEPELRGAILRIQTNDYLVQQTEQRAAQRMSATLSLGLFVPRSLIRRVASNSTEPVFDQRWLDSDMKLLHLERCYEEPNLNETTEEFIERKRRELNPKKD